MLDVKKLLAKILNSPFIVEEGTSGIWTYRKWSDGVAECWGNTGIASRAITQSYGGQYFRTLAVSLPSGLFTSVTSATGCRADIGASNSSLVSITIHSVSTSSLSSYIYCQVSTTVNAGFSFEVKGRWK